MKRIDTPNAALDLFGAGKNGYRDGNKAAGINPTELSAAIMNGLQEELAAIPESVGMVLDGANNHQVLEAIQRMIDAQSGNYALDTGAANAYVIALNPAIAAYPDGLTVRFKITNSNTGASTLNAGAGAVALVNDAGGALAQGDAPAGNIATATYIAAAGKFYLTSMVQSQMDVRYAPLLGGQLIGFQIFTASGAYTKGTNNPSYIIVEAIGGGGQGSGASNSFSGAAAGYAKAKFLAAVLGASETVTIGAGGSTSGAGADGQNGGTTSFGTTPGTVGISCTGGQGGLSGGTTPVGGTATVVGSVANSAIALQGGDAPYAQTTGAGVAGVPSQFGAGGSPYSGTALAANSGAAHGYGAGGGSRGLTGYAGGAGKQGVVIVWEYK